GEQQTKARKNRNPGYRMGNETKTDQSVLRARPKQSQERIERQQSRANEFINLIGALVSLSILNRFWIIGVEKLGVAHSAFRPRFQKVTHGKGRRGFALLDQKKLLVLEIDRYRVQIPHFPIGHRVARLDENLLVANGHLVGTDP